MAQMQDVFHLNHSLDHGADQRDGRAQVLAGRWDRIIRSHISKDRTSVRRLYVAEASR